MLQCQWVRPCTSAPQDPRSRITSMTSTVAGEDFLSARAATDREVDQHQQLHNTPTVNTSTEMFSRHPARGIFIETENFRSKWKNHLPTLRLATHQLQSAVEAEAPTSEVATGNESLPQYLINDQLEDCFSIHSLCSICSVARRFLSRSDQSPQFAVFREFSYDCRGGCIP